MHKAALAHFNLSGCYDLIDVTPAILRSRLAELKRSYQGLNVTIPHKQAVMPLLDGLTPESKIVQAVNTIRIEPDGRAIGHNTDSAGFLAALQAASGGGTTNFPTVCLIGAGGAARAALWAVARIGAKQVVIVARTHRDARMMRDDFAKSGGNLQIILRSPGEPLNSNAPSLIVNCTPIGLSAEAIPPWVASLMQTALRGPVKPTFFDMVYSRSGGPTPLVKQASELGLIACDGLSMLIEQAALAFEFWTGLKVPTSVMASGLSQQDANLIR